MGRYLTPLPGLLARAINDGLNQAIELDPTAAERLRSMRGKTVRLVLERLGIDLYFTGHDESLQVSAESTLEPDTTITGAPSALLAMAVPDWRDSGSGVRIEGDAGTAQALEKLMRRLDPDWEALLVRHLGPVFGHQAWRMLRDTLEHSRHGARTLADQVGHYLREESGLLVTREEAEQFVNDVDELREAVDRLETRSRRQGRA